MAPTIITLVYPVSSTTPFNSEYYVSSHMPLAQKHWGPLGLISWHAAKLNEKTGYVMQGIMFWESLEKFQAAVQSEGGKEISADLPNYSAERPITYVGSEVGSG